MPFRVRANPCRYMLDLMTRFALDYVALIFAWGSLAGGQEVLTVPVNSSTCQLAGSVADNAGSTIHNATIKAVLGPGFIRHAGTDSDGKYLMKLLMPGHWKLEISSPGFQTERKDFVCMIYEDYKIDVVLERAPK